MLIIDVKEKVLIETCRKFGIKHEVRTLPIGDITNDKNTFIAERKSCNDFWGSMVKEHLDNQLGRMYEGYDSNRYVFVETGSLEDLAEEHRKDRDWIYSKFGDVENWNCHFKEYVSMTDLAYKLKWLDIKLGGKRIFKDQKVEIYHTTNAVRALAQFDGIGKKKAEVGLKDWSFKEFVDDLFNNDAKKISERDGYAPLKKKNSILSKLKLEMERVN